MKKYVRNKILEYVSITSVISALLSYLILEINYPYGSARKLDLINFITAFIPFWVITNVIGIYIVAYRHGKKEQRSNQQ
ncbi:MAG: hypothetical protein ACYCR7_06465 [Thermoplasmataceae archaeon]